MKGPKQTREKASKCCAPVSDLRYKSLKVISVKTSVLYIQQKQKLSKNARLCGVSAKILHDKNMN